MKHIPAGLSGEEIARYIAHQKAMLFKNDIKPDEIVITADTIVWCNNKVLGKPSDEDEAKQILKGNIRMIHMKLLQGFHFFHCQKRKLFSESTKVTFRKLSEEEISYYVHNYKPFDKAGAYGIQEWIGISCVQFH